MLGGSADPAALRIETALYNHFEIGLLPAF